MKKCEILVLLQSIAATSNFKVNSPRQSNMIAWWPLQRSARKISTQMLYWLWRFMDTNKVVKVWQAREQST